MKHTRSLVIALALAAGLATSTAWAADGDRDISRQVATDLIRTVAIGPYGIQVRAQNGVVRLNGSVGTINDWKRAEQQAREVAGVSEVQNNLSVLIR